MERPSLRATDADRERVIALLRQASIDGRLTVEELAERAERAEQARTHDELAAITADLVPAGALAVAPTGAGIGERVEVHRATLATLERRGRWRLPPRSRFVAVLGSVQLDLRQAVLPGPEVEIELKAVLGSCEVVVPPGTDVRVSGGNALGACTFHLGEEAPPPGAPVVHVRIAGALGSVDVRAEPRLADRLKAEARRLAERWLSGATPGSARRR
jgi:hypothetical protein